MSPACQGLIFVTCFAASRQGGGESLADDGEMAGRMRPSRAHITPNTTHTAQGDPNSPIAPLSWMQRLKRVFRIDIEGCPQCGARLRVTACIETPDYVPGIFCLPESLIDTLYAEGLCDSTARTLGYILEATGIQSGQLNIVNGFAGAHS